MSIRAILHPPCGGERWRKEEEEGGRDHKISGRLSTTFGIIFFLFGKSHDAFIVGCDVKERERERKKIRFAWSILRGGVFL